MRPVKGMGGKAARLKQRELRQMRLETGIFEMDITDTWPEWRPMLRALPNNMQQLIVGHGITQVKFRLLKGVRDSNWAKKDSGERHVFKTVRTDRSKMHCIITRMEAWTIRSPLIPLACHRMRTVAPLGLLCHSLRLLRRSLSLVDANVCWHYNCF